MLADVMMPSLDGFALLRELRSDPETRSLPVILLSARAGEESRVEGLEAGADDYLIKPFSARELLARVGAHLEMARIRREATAAVRESEERFTRFMHHLPGLAWIKDLQGRYVYANDAAVKAFRMPREKLYGKTDDEVFPPETAAQFKENDRRALSSETGIQTIESLEHEDGVMHYSIVSKFPISGADGKVAIVGGVAIDITERKQMEEALHEADRRKDEFLAMLAHELRNPLAPICNAVQVMRLLGPAEPKLQWACEVIDRQVAHLVRLVDDLLDVSRIIRGKITLQKAPLELGRVVERALELSRLLIEARRHRLCLLLPPAPVRLEGDLVRLAQVIGNLLNNAAKYTPEGGRIWLTASRENGQAVIRVRDTGEGIPGPLLAHLFELFTQGQRTLDRAQGGLGIGLTIVKRLVALHGGTVEAKSEGPGRGSEFVVRLPALSEAEQEVEREGDALSRTAPRKGVRVLVVEDNVDAAESVAMLLALEGHETRTAPTGIAALELVPRFQPEVVVLDIGLPGMDGYEVARRLRAAPETQHVVLIALTGYGQAEDYERTKAAGFNHHLVKPVELKQLCALLAHDQAGRCTGATGQS